MPLPITPLTMAAVRLQRPIARISDGWANRSELVEPVMLTAWRPYAVMGR